MAKSRLTYRPTGNRNQRRAACRGCGCNLPKGAGYQWDYDRNPLTFTASKYFCRLCHAHKLARLELEPEVRQALDRIETWCKEHVSLSMGWHASQHIAALVDRCDLMAADVANEIAGRLDELTETSYSTVVSLAYQVARQMEEAQ